MADRAPTPSPTDDVVAPRVGLAGWARGLVRRASEPDAWQAAVVTAVVAAAVFALATRPQHGEVGLDLREGDAVGGWSQLTLVGFSVTRPFGRVVPDPPGRADLRIVSNRPLPADFELELVGWTLRPGHPVELTVVLDGVRQTRRFGAERTSRRIAFANPGGARTLELSLGPDDKLAVERIVVRERDGSS